MESANKRGNRGGETKNGRKDKQNGKWKVRRMHSTTRSALLCAFSKRPPPTIVPGRQWPDEPVLSNLSNSGTMKGPRGSRVRSPPASTCLLGLDEIAFVREPLPSKYLFRHSNSVLSIQQLLILFFFWAVGRSATSIHNSPQGKQWPDWTEYFWNIQSIVIRLGSLRIDGEWVW